MLQFTEEEITLPSGPYKDLKFKAARNPFAKHYFDEIDKRIWKRHAICGVQQSGKSLIGYVIPALYHLFEIGETVVCGVPDMNMAADKWSRDFLPVILKSRYRHLLPGKGQSSRGGTKVSMIEFGNGAALRFMGAGGDDKTRAGFTSRVLVATEVDGYDAAAEKSREANPVAQMEGRLGAFDENIRVYLECTVSLESGRIWKEYKAGTESKIVRPCPHCKAWVTPEREDLVGWQGAADIIEAREGAAIKCPACASLWSEQERKVANADSRLVHRGQEVGPEGNIIGPVPRTDTFSYRWNAADNNFVSAGTVAAREWKSANDPDDPDGDRALCQWFWTLPFKGDKEETHGVSYQDIIGLAVNIPRGICPATTRFVTVGADVQKRLVYWLALAWLEGASCHIVDYGVIERQFDALGEERSLLIALNELRDMAQGGWMVSGTGTNGDAKKLPALQTWIDSQYHTQYVHAACRAAGLERFLPFRGFGETQNDSERYSHPKEVNRDIKYIGADYYIRIVPEYQTWRADVNSDVWKSFLHSRIKTPSAQPGALTLFANAAGRGDKEHHALAMHWTAETKYTEFVPAHGQTPGRLVTRWGRQRKDNHWLDCGYAGCAAGHYCGARVATVDIPVVEQRRVVQEPVKRRDGRGWWQR